jgi:hypothetical protein
MDLHLNFGSCFHGMANRNCFTFIFSTNRWNNYAWRVRRMWPSSVLCLKDTVGVYGLFQHWNRRAVSTRCIWVYLFRIILAVNGDRFFKYY